ncbi:MAG: hypothetical protein AB7P02_27535 [Alphaproteobacteria bacterium]
MASAFLPSRRLTIMAAALAVAAFAAPASAQRQPTVIKGAGDVAPLIGQYRHLLGEPNNGNAAGPLALGRREINWDGVPDDKAAPNFLPGDFFKGRGAMLSTPGQGVQVSAKETNPTNTPPRFGHINPSYARIFKAYSGERLFSPVGSRFVDLTFVVPGTDIPAAVKGFGAVYVDTDLPHTSFQYFDAHGRSLGKFPVPAMNEGFTFLGVLYDGPVVARVRIEYGTTALGPDDDPKKKKDVSVMDDFIFGEPQAIGSATVAARRR